MIKKASTPIVELEKKGILVKMNLFLEYTMRSLKKLNQCIWETPKWRLLNHPYNIQDICTRMLMTPSEPVKMMWTCATKVITALMSKYKQTQWRNTYLYLKHWGRGQFDGPMTLDQYFAYTGPLGFSENVCKAFSYILCCLGACGWSERSS